MTPFSEVLSVRHLCVGGKRGLAGRGPLDYFYTSCQGWQRLTSSAALSKACAGTVLQLQEAAAYCSGQGHRPSVERKREWQHLPESASQARDMSWTRAGHLLLAGQAALVQHSIWP